MATVYMNPYALTQQTPAALPGADNGYQGVQKCLIGQLTYASQGSATVIVAGILPAGSFYLGGDIYTDVTTGSATLAIGGTQAPTTASTALTSLGTFQANCYKAAAALTSVDVPVPFFSNVSATHPFLLGTPQKYGYPETFKITTAAASLPAAGNLLVFIYYM